MKRLKKIILYALLLSAIGYVKEYKAYIHPDSSVVNATAFIDYSYYYDLFSQNGVNVNLKKLIDLDKQYPNKKMDIFYSKNNGFEIGIYTLGNNNDEKYYYFTRNSTSTSGYYLFSIEKRYTTNYWNFDNYIAYYHYSLNDFTTDITTNGVYDMFVDTYENNTAGNTNGYLQNSTYPIPNTMLNGNDLLFNSNISYTIFLYTSFHTSNGNIVNDTPVYYTGGKNSSYRYYYSQLVFKFADNYSEAYFAEDEISTYYQYYNDSIGVPDTYNIENDTTVDYFDYIYNDLNATRMKRDILNAIEYDSYITPNCDEEQETCAINNVLFINYIKDSGVDVIIADKNNMSNYDIKYYNNPKNMNSSTGFMQGINLPYTKYIHRLFTFDEYATAMGGISATSNAVRPITNYVKNNINHDFTTDSKLLYMSDNDEFGNDFDYNDIETYDDDYLYSYLIYKPSYFNIKYVEGTKQNGLLYYDSMTLVIDENNVYISNALEYSYKSIYEMYSWKTTNGTGQDKYVCDPNLDCYGPMYQDDVVYTDTLGLDYDNLKGPVSDILTFPLTLMNNLVTNLTDSKNGTCNALQLTLPHSIGTIRIPCVRTIFNDMGILNTIETLMLFVCAYMLIRYFIYLLHWFENLLSFDVDMDFIVDTNWKWHKY